MRIAELILDAYKKIGLIPAQKTWLSSDGKRACGLTALGLYSKAVLFETALRAAQTLDGMNPVIQNWAGPKFGHSWQRGFISGFDSLSLDYAVYIYGDRTPEFEDGHREGRRTWQMVSSQLKTPVQENNSKLEQSETTEQEEVVSISSQHTLCSV